MKKLVLGVVAILTVGVWTAQAAGKCCALPAATAQVGSAQATGCSQTACPKLEDCLSKLELTEEQAKQVAAIRKESGCDTAPTPGACPIKSAAQKKACRTAIVALLTDAQKAKLAELCTKECAVQNPKPAN